MRENLLALSALDLIGETPSSFLIEYLQHLGALSQKLSFFSRAAASKIERQRPFCWPLVLMVA
jgi:hypothetical protein